MTESQSPRNLTAALLVIAFAQLMVVLDTTIVNVALPSIQRALDETGPFRREQEDQPVAPERQPPAIGGPRGRGCPRPRA